MQHLRSSGWSDSDGSCDIVSDKEFFKRPSTNLDCLKCSLNPRRNRSHSSLSGIKLQGKPRDNCFRVEKFVKDYDSGQRVEFCSSSPCDHDRYHVGWKLREIVRSAWVTRPHPRGSAPSSSWQEGGAGGSLVDNTCSFNTHVVECAEECTPWCSQYSMSVRAVRWMYMDNQSLTIFEAIDVCVAFRQEIT